MDTDCAPLIADLFLFCYERDLMTSLPDDKQADIFDAFNTTSRYLIFLLRNFPNKAIGIINFGNLFSIFYRRFYDFSKCFASFISTFD